MCTNAVRAHFPGQEGCVLCECVRVCLLQWKWEEWGVGCFEVICFFLYNHHLLAIEKIFSKSIVLESIRSFLISITQD